MKKILVIILSLLLVLQMSLSVSANITTETPISEVLNFGTITNIDDYSIELKYEKTVSDSILSSTTAEQNSEIRQLTVCKIITNGKEDTERICNILNSRANGTLTEDKVGGIADIYSTITYSTSMTSSQIYVRIISATGGVTRVEPSAQVTNHNVIMGQNGYVMGSGYIEQKTTQNYPYTIGWTLTPPSSFKPVAVIDGRTLVGCTLTTTVVRGTGTYRYSVVNNIYEH